MTDDLPMLTVYDHPLDFPAHIVVRRWLIGSGGSEPRDTGEYWLFDSLEAARHKLVRLGLYCLPREPGDDPAIVETWL